MSKNILISILSLAALSVFAIKVASVKYNTIGDRLYSKKVCAEDLKWIADQIRNTHPAPFDYISEVHFNQLLQSQISELGEQNTLRDFHWNARKLIASIGCGHTSLTGELEEREIADSLLFPMDVRFVGERLYLINDCDKNSNLTSGTEVLSINGQTTKEILSSMIKRVSSDGLNPAYPTYSINREPHFFLSQHFALSDHYELDIISDNERQNVTIESGVWIAPDPAATYNEREQLSVQLDPDNDVAVLTLRSFNYYRNDFEVYREFLDSSMQKIFTSNINNLIIDIRGNGGGSPECANHLLRYISSSPYQYFHNQNIGYPELKKEILPSGKNYKGKSYMIIDGGCGSTSGHLASLVKYYKPAILVGETSGATYKCHDNSTNIALPNTRLNLHIARNTFKTAVTGMSVSTGVIPDIIIEKSLDDWIYETDSVMDSLYQIISK